jgi:hypothetical protein
MSMHEQPKDTMISSVHSYGHGYLAVADIQMQGLPETVEFDGEQLLRKTEFHISLACLKRLAPMINPDQPSIAEAEMLRLFQGFILSEPMNNFELLPELRYVERDKRATIVVMTAVPGLIGYFDLLRQHFDTELPDQPTHISLYTRQPDAGISISSAEDLASDTRIVIVPELGGLRVAAG